MKIEQQPTANVIKRPSNGDATRGVIKNQTIAARHEAEHILALARAKADAIIRDAAEEAERIRDEAYRDGAEKSLAEFEKHLLDAREIRSNVMNDVERDVLSLSVRIAEKILGGELASNKKAITGIVSAALTNARQREKVTVSVNPADLEIVAAESEKYSSDTKIRFLDFVADPSVPAGGCVIETEVGKIDALLETQFKAIEMALLDRSESERNA
jgi:type III secretion protein L